MKEYEVTFIQASPYTVEADSPEEAEAIAKDLFDKDMRRPIARTDYDDVEVIEVND